MQNRSDERDALALSPFATLPDEITPVIAEQLSINPVIAIYGLHALRCTSRFFHSHLQSQFDDFHHLQVSIGDHHLLILRPDGKLFGYGKNDHGELSVDTSQKFPEVKTVTAIHTPSLLKQVLAQSNLTLALSANGKHLYHCGTVNNITSFTEIATSLPVHEKMMQITYGNTCGWMHTSPGKLYRFKICLQTNEAILTSITLPKNLQIKKMIAGDHHLVILSKQGQLYGCGANTNGQLALGNQVKYQKELVEIALPPSILKITDIAVGNTHTIVLTEEGTAYGCGKNQMGQLGNNTKKPLFSLTALNIPLLDKKEKINKIATGNNHTVVLTSNGKLYHCGSNSDGQMNLGSDKECLLRFTDVEVQYDGQIKELYAGGNRTFFLTTDNKLYVWGADNPGQMGIDREADELLYHVREVNLVDTKPQHKLMLRM